MIKGIALLTFVMVFITACGTVREFDAASGTFKKDKQSIAPWKVDERDDAIISALDEHGKIKVETVKERNPMFDWLVGGGMVTGALLMFLSIVWIAYNVAYLAAQYLKSGFLGFAVGLGTFAVSYLLSEYIGIVIGVLTAVFVGGVVWLVWYLKKERKKAEAAVKTVQLAKNDLFTNELKQEVRELQGEFQPMFKKIKNELFPD